MVSIDWCGRCVREFVPGKGISGCRYFSGDADRFPSIVVGSIDWLLFFWRSDSGVNLGRWFSDFH